MKEKVEKRIRWVWEGHWAKYISVRAFFAAFGIELLSGLILGMFFSNLGIPDRLSIAIAFSLCWIPAAGYLLFKKISS